MFGHKGLTFQIYVTDKNRWNSAVFETTQQLDYNVFVVTPSFLNISPVNCSQNVSVSYNTETFPAEDRAVPYNVRNQLSYNATNESYTNATLFGLPYQASDEVWYQQNVCSISQALQTNSTQGLLTRLSNEECINAYGPGDNRLKGYGNLLVVTKEQPANWNATILMQFTNEVYVSNYTADGWVCSPDYLIANNYKCNYKKIAANASDWNLGPPKSDPDNDYRLTATEQWPVDYCLAQRTDLSGLCQLQYSLIIMIIVLIANSIKLSCIMFLLWTHMEPILATIGDGIASFLERPDRITAFRPFLDRSAARKFNRLEEKRTPVRWSPKQLRWWHAPSTTRWVLTLTLYVVRVRCFLSDTNLLDAR
jgi:hypothetical protein